MYLPNNVSSSAVFSLICTLPALYYFVNKEKNTDISPAESRDMNQDCQLLSYYDGYDWTKKNKLLRNVSCPPFSDTTSGISLVVLVSSLPSCSSSQLMKTSSTRRGLKFQYSNHISSNINQNVCIPTCVDISQECNFCSINEAFIVSTCIAL